MIILQTLRNYYFRIVIEDYEDHPLHVTQYWSEKFPQNLHYSFLGRIQRITI